MLRLATPSCAPALPSRRAALRPATTCAALDAPRGRVVWLDFWAYWCGPCRLSFPWMDAMQSRFGAHGLQVLAVNLDATPEPARRFLAEHPASFAVGFDPSDDTARRFSVKAMPTPVLIGADGRVLATHAGLRDADRDALEATIRDALARRTASAGGTR